MQSDRDEKVDDEETGASRVKSNRGFASMTPERRAELGRKGGINAHASGNAHQYKPGKEARAAGRKGGAATAKKTRKTSTKRKKQRRPKR